MIEVFALNVSSRTLATFPSRDGDMYLLPGSNSILLVHESSFVTLLQPGAVRSVTRGAFAHYGNLIAIPITKLSITAS